MKRRLAIAIALFFLGAGVTSCGSDAPSKSDARIEEDDPGWNCETMGNRICGPIDQDASELNAEVGPAWECWGEPKIDGSIEFICHERLG